MLKLTKAWKTQSIVKIQHHGDIVEVYGKNNLIPDVELVLTKFMLWASAEDLAKAIRSSLADISNNQISECLVRFSGILGSL